LDSSYTAIRALTPLSNSDIMPSALLIGAITHARKEWEDLSSILTLKEFPEGPRDEFIRNCKEGQYDDVVVIYRSNASTKVNLAVERDDNGLLTN
jgi:hypothetical protein